MKLLVLLGALGSITPNALKDVINDQHSCLLNPESV